MRDNLDFNSALIRALVDGLLEFVIVPTLASRLGNGLPPHLITRAKHALIEGVTGHRSWADMKAVALEVADTVIREHERSGAAS